MISNSLKQKICGAMAILGLLGFITILIIELGYDKDVNNWLFYCAFSFIFVGIMQFLRYKKRDRWDRHVQTQHCFGKFNKKVPDFEIKCHVLKVLYKKFLTLLYEKLLAKQIRYRQLIQGSQIQKNRIWCVDSNRYYHCNSNCNDSVDRLYSL